MNSWPRTAPHAPPTAGATQHRRAPRHGERGRWTWRAGGGGGDVPRRMGHVMASDFNAVTTSVTRGPQSRGYTNE